MSDFTNPIGGPSLMDLGQRPRWGTGQTPHTKFGETVETGVPEADAWMLDWQMKNIGRRIEHSDKDLINSISQHINGRPMFNFAAPQQLEVDPYARPRVKTVGWNEDRGWRNWGPLRALGHGFETSTIGALQRWLSLDAAMNFQSDPDYDPWADPAINNGPFKNRRELFETSKSAQESLSIMQYMKRFEKEASFLDAMSENTGIFQLAGSMLGDPLVFTPATLGVRAVRMAERAAAIARPDSVATGFVPIVLGGVRDSVRSAATQAVISLVDASVHHQLDPSSTIGSISDIVSLPATIGAAIGLVTGLRERNNLAMFGLQRQDGDARFMAGTRARARNLPDGQEGPAAPGVLTDFERAYWERRATKHSDSRVHVDGELKGWAGGNAIFETSEGLTVRIPMKEIDIASEKGARGIIVSVQHLITDPALMGSAMRLDGEFIGGALPRVWKQGANVYAPGALHSEYAGMRSREYAQSATGKATGYVDEGPPPLDGVTAVVKRGEDPRGEFTMETTDKGALWASRFPIGTRITAEDGGEFVVTKGKAANDRPYFKRSKYAEKKPAAGDRVVDKEFKPGELQAADDTPGVTKTAAGTAKPVLDDLAEATADIDIAKGEGGLSAGAAPRMSGLGSAVSRRKILEGNRFVPTGLSSALDALLQKVDILGRASTSPFTAHQDVTENLFSPGGRVRVKNTAAGGNEPTALPVEIVMKVQWAKPTSELLRGVRDDWYKYRTGNAHPSPSDIQRIGYELLETVKDKFTSNPKGMSFEAFRRRIGDALINGDSDLVIDSATPMVEASMRRARVLLERVKQEGMDVGLFKAAHEEQLLKKQENLAALRLSNASADKIAAAEQDVRNVEKLLQDVISGGPKVNTARSYRPRVWLVDQLLDREREFKNIVTTWLRNTEPTLSVVERQQIADKIHDTLVRDTAAYGKKDVDQLFKDLADPSSAKGRTFQIPDMMVKDFLENDVDVLMRGHTRTMGAAIEMHRRFGSTGLEDQVAEIQAEARLLIKHAPTNEMKRDLAKRRDSDIADLMAGRDRLYGVYGAPEDPHRWSSRAIRMAKQYTNLTVLGMSGVTAMGDLIRPLMTEGLQATHDYGFRSLASNTRGIILKMSREQIELAADGMELITNTRALSQSDAGDAFRSRTPFERGLAKANSWFFVMNGLNMVNQIDKEWAGLVIQGNMNKTLASLVSGGKVDPVLVQRLAVNGIDDSMAGRIMREMNKTGGSNTFGKLTLADSAKWTDEQAALSYRVALNQMINRTIPTPTLSDTPHWFSTEVGGLMTQYKSFVFGAMNRTVVSGLQEEGAKYWLGAAGAVGFAMILNELRSRLFYDRSTFDKPMTAVIMDAVDRSSILGYFSDANKAIETLTGHRAGIRPFIGADRPRVEEASRVLGTVAGPFAGQSVNALSVFGDILSGDHTVKTMADARQLMPWQNVPYMDPVMDRFISDGSRFPKRDPKGKKPKGVNRPEPILDLGP